jgi:2-oxoisovalerate dehydrogenase E1 component alpha subunit
LTIDPAGLLPPEEPVRFLSPDGTTSGLPDDIFGLTDEDLVGLYRDMVRTRRLDTLAIALQRQGQLGVWASCRGQEAAQVGIAWAMGLRDWVFPSYREHGVTLVRGVPFVSLLQQYRGTWMGLYDPHEYQVAPHSIPIATHLLHAVGFAKAAKLRGDDLVTVAFIGDGGTSEGDFHEALNFAAVWDAPTVFVVQNNQFAISVPASAQTRAPSIAHKAIGYGMQGYRVDGNDVIASFAVAREAIGRARSGQGPALIEAHTYRMQPHTTADDDTRYRPHDDLAEWETKDPITRMERWLTDLGILDDDDLSAITEDAELEALGARKEAVESAAAPLTDLFDHVFVNPPAGLVAQRRAAVAAAGRVDT